MSMNNAALELALRQAMSRLTAAMVNRDAPNSLKLGGFTLAEITAAILAGTAANATLFDGHTYADVLLAVTGGSAQTIGDVEAALAAFIARQDNPHNVTKTQVGLGLVENYGIASQVDADAKAADKYVTPFIADYMVQKAVDALVGAAPETLNTINEIAAALGNDPDVINNLTSLIGTKETPAGAQAKADAAEADAIAAAALDATAKADVAEADAKAYTDAAIAGVDASLGRATQLEAEAGLDNVKLMTSLRTAQAIAAIGATLFLGKTEQAADSAKLEGLSKAQIIAEAQAGVDMSNVVQKTDDFGQYSVGGQLLSVLLNDLASDADLTTLQASFNAFVAAKATEAEAVAGTDNTKYITALSAKAAIDAAVAALAGTAPEALNTINELAAALNNDPDVINNLMTQIAGKTGLADVQAEISTVLDGLGITNAVDMRVGAAGATYITGTVESLSQIGEIVGYARGSQLGLTGPAGMRYGVVRITGQIPEVLTGLSSPTLGGGLVREFTTSLGSYYQVATVASGSGTEVDPYIWGWGTPKTRADLDSTVKSATAVNMIVGAETTSPAFFGTDTLAIYNALATNYSVQSIVQMAVVAVDSGALVAAGEVDIPGVTDQVASGIDRRGRMEIFHSGTKLIRRVILGSVVYSQYAVNAGGGDPFTAWERIGGDVALSANADRLGGELPSFYATAQALSDEAAARSGETAALDARLDTAETTLANKVTVGANVDTNTVTVDNAGTPEQVALATVIAQLKAAVAAAESGADADIAALQTAFNNFVAAKATGAEVIAGTDDAKYTTSLAVKTAIDQAIADLAGTAPEALNTINELAAALNNDPDVINNLMTQIGTKLNQAQVQAEIATALVPIDARIDTLEAAVGEGSNFLQAGVSNLGTNPVVLANDPVSYSIESFNPGTANYSVVRNAGELTVQVDPELDGTFVTPAEALGAALLTDLSDVLDGFGAVDGTTYFITRTVTSKTLKQHVEALEVADQALDDRITGEVAGLNAAIDTVTSGYQTAVAGVQTSLDGLTATVGANQTELDGRLDTLEAAAPGLQTKTGTLDANTVEVMVDATPTQLLLKNVLAQLQANIDAVEAGGEADLTALQNSFNAFVAAKASGAEVIAGTDDAKYTTSLSVKAAIDAAIQELAGTAPAALNTINELAAALNNDPDIINTLMTQISTKLEATATAADSSKLGGVVAADYATKAYVDTGLADTLEVITEGFIANALDLSSMFSGDLTIADLGAGSFGFGASGSIAPAVFSTYTILGLSWNGTTVVLKLQGDTTALTVDALMINGEVLNAFVSRAINGTDTDYTFTLDKTLPTTGTVPVLF